MITQQALKKHLEYSPDTGEFTWILPTNIRRTKKGDKAAYSNGSGYCKIGIFGKRYYAHRLAFLYMTGELPKEVDHINHNRSDNRWRNLRASNRAENCANVPRRKGVRYRYGKWYARWSHTHLGVFGTEEEAIQARRDAVIKAAGVDPDEVHYISNP